MDDGYVDGMRQRGFVVRRVWMPSSGAESWTVVGLDRVPVGPVESYLAWLANVGRSPNTVRAYAHDLKLFWTFLADRGSAGMR